MSTKIGEVIEAKTSQFLAQCYELHQAPPLGSLVRTEAEGISIYAVVGEATTQSLDPGRRPTALGKDLSRQEEIYTQHPQLSQLFATCFPALVVGHQWGEHLYYYLPPRPAPLHSFVYPCEPAEIAQFSRSLDFLSLLLSREGLGDEVVAACLRQASQAHPEPRAFLVRAGKELAQLLSGQLPRLNALLKRIRA